MVVNFIESKRLQRICTFPRVTIGDSLKAAVCARYFCHRHKGVETRGDFELIGLAVPPSAVVVGITLPQSSLVRVYFAICEKYTSHSNY